MESFGESGNAPLLMQEEQEELDLSNSFFLPPSSCFSDLFVDVKEIEQNPVEAAALYHGILQADHIRDFGIRIKEICKLEIYWVEGESKEGLNSKFDSLPTSQCFKNPYETLDFLRHLEKINSKHQSDLMDFRKDYEKHLKPRERKNKREQTEAIPKIAALYNRIKDSYSSVITDESIENMTNVFKLEQLENYKALNISLGKNNDVEYIFVHFNKLDETYLFLQELGNLDFLTPSMLQEIEAMIRSVATLINSRK
jgi:hypothetical protein